MSATYTERDLILAQRRAYADGIVRGAAREFNSLASAEEAARLAFPLPKVTRPRVVADPRGAEWRVVDGMIEWRWSDANMPWRRLDAKDSGMYVTKERVLILADLLANPTETVEDGAA